MAHVAACLPGHDEHGVLLTGVGLLARQRSVNECLSEEMPNIHAFTMKTWTPSQYEKKKASL